MTDPTEQAVDREMADYVEGVKERFLQSVKGGEWFAEQKVDFSPWVLDGAFGTADMIGYTPHDKTLIIADLKYGRGVQVFAEGSEQLRLYGLGTYNDFEWIGDIERVVMVIDQPRKGHYDVAEMPLEDLLHWGETVAKPQAGLAVSADPPFGPGEKACQWCKAKANCIPLADHMATVISQEFDILLDDEIDVSAPGALPVSILARVLSHKKTLNNWIAALEERALSELKEGNTVPGFKAVLGRSRRAWGDETAAATFLRKRLKVSEAYSKELISPAQAEKLYGKKKGLLSDYIVSPQGPVTLAPTSDKRKDVYADVKEEFSDLTGEGNND